MFINTIIADTQLTAIRIFPKSLHKSFLFLKEFFHFKVFHSTKKQTKKNIFYSPDSPAKCKT